MIAIKYNILKMRKKINKINKFQKERKGGEGGQEKTGRKEGTKEEGRQCSLYSFNCYK
jgi:hypothetical protein